jgi:prepilin-type N-terminal cleavage/methylation domain-containing protein
MKNKFYIGQSGFSLIEIIVGVAIIATIGLVLINAIDTNAKSRGILDEKVQATNIITAYLEGIRQVPYSATAHPYASVEESIYLPNQYLLDVSIDYSPDGTNWFADDNSGSYKLQRIGISVLREGGKYVLSTCTFKTTRVKQ